jgi:predicted adenylyl cyclase CyaB
MKNVEIEVRSFISPVQYKSLEKKLNRVAKFLKEIKEETVYLERESLRIRRDNSYSYLIFKSGKIHDNFRSEIKIRFERTDFDKLKDLFEKLGFNIDVMWFRERNVYDLKGIKVFLDKTKGYGMVVELEKFGTEQNKEKIYDDLKAKLLSLGIKEITPKKEFDKKFKYYKNNWRKILNLKA